MSREIALAVLLLPAPAGCQFEPRGSTALDPGSADAAPDRSDDDPCEGWHPAAPFDPCLVAERGGDLMLAGPGRYLYDTSNGLLRLEGGEPIAHASEVVDGVRLVSADAVVLAAEAQLRVEGELPLLLIGWSAIEIAGAIDASSTIIGQGAGADPPSCPVAPPSASAGSPLDGGGGGGFATPGGAGGHGAAPGPGGPPGPAVAGTIGLRGGCPGADGTPPGSGGSGGGAVALSAREELTVSGRVLASGAGGAGGAIGGGGGGGGSGGHVWLEAPDIALAATAILAANGGGGGEGGDADDAGDPGDDPLTDGGRAHGGRSAANDGGDGGDGTADRDASGKSGKNGAGDNGAGGGGGGGGGLVRLVGRVDDAGARITPDPPDDAVAPAAGAY